MRYSRLRKFRKRNPIYMLVLKIVVIWYMALFTAAYFSADTAAKYTFQKETVHSITAGLWEEGCVEGESQKGGSVCTEEEELDAENDEKEEKKPSDTPAAEEEAVKEGKEETEKSAESSPIDEETPELPTTETDKKEDPQAQEQEAEEPVAEKENEDKEMEEAQLKSEEEEANKEEEAEES